MADYLNTLAARALGQVQPILPRRRYQFEVEPDFGTSQLESDTLAEAEYASTERPSRDGTSTNEPGVKEAGDANEILTPPPSSPANQEEVAGIRPAQADVHMDGQEQTPERPPSKADNGREPPKQHDPPPSQAVILDDTKRPSREPKSLSQAVTLIETPPTRQRTGHSQPLSARRGSNTRARGAEARDPETRGAEARDPETRGAEAHDPEARGAEAPGPEARHPSVAPAAERSFDPRRRRVVNGRASTDGRASVEREPLHPRGLQANHRGTLETPGQPPQIKVSIGRVEVRAIRPAAPIPRPKPQAERSQPKLTLEEYLRRGRRPRS